MDREKHIEVINKIRGACHDLNDELDFFREFLMDYELPEVSEDDDEDTSPWDTYAVMILLGREIATNVATIRGFLNGVKNGFTEKEKKDMHTLVVASAFDAVLNRVQNDLGDKVKMHTEQFDGVDITVVKVKP